MGEAPRSDRDRQEARRSCSSFPAHGRRASFPVAEGGRIRHLFFAAALMTGIALIAGSASYGEQGRVAALGGKQLELLFPVKGLVFVVDDIGGKAKDLEVKETKTEIHIDLAADVLFDFDKSTLRPSARDTLHQAASIIRSNAKARAGGIDGYADAKGSDSYNQQLSERRAEAVRNWFVANEGLNDVDFAD